MNFTGHDLILPTSTEEDEETFVRAAVAAWPGAVVVRASSEETLIYASSEVVASIQREGVTPSFAPFLVSMVRTDQDLTLVYEPSEETEWVPRTANQILRCRGGERASTDWGALRREIRDRFKAVDAAVRLACGDRENAERFRWEKYLEAARATILPTLPALPAKLASARARGLKIARVYETRHWNDEAKAHLAVWKEVAEELYLELESAEYDLCGAIYVKIRDTYPDEPVRSKSA